MFTKLIQDTSHYPTTPLHMVLIDVDHTFVIEKFVTEKYQEQW